jgi:hypothetical protein
MSVDEQYPVALPDPSLGNNQFVHYLLGEDASAEDYRQAPLARDLGVRSDLDKGGLQWNYFHITDSAQGIHVFGGGMYTQTLNPKGIDPRLSLVVRTPDGAVCREVVSCDPKTFSADELGLNATFNESSHMHTVGGQDQYVDGGRVTRPLDIEVKLHGKRIGIDVVSRGKYRPTWGGTGGTKYGRDLAIHLGWFQYQPFALVSGTLKVDDRTYKIKDAVGHMDSGNGNSPKSLKQENHWYWRVLNGDNGRYVLVESTATACAKMGNETRQRIVLGVDGDIIGEDPRRYMPMIGDPVRVVGTKDNFRSLAYSGSYLGDDGKTCYIWHLDAGPEIFRSNLLSMTNDSPLVAKVAGFLNDSGILFTGRYQQHHIDGVLRTMVLGKNDRWRLKETVPLHGVQELYHPKNQRVK